MEIHSGHGKSWKSHGISRSSHGISFHTKLGASHVLILGVKNALKLIYARSWFKKFPLGDIPVGGQDRVSRTRWRT